VTEAGDKEHTSFPFPVDVGEGHECANQHNDISEREHKALKVYTEHLGALSGKITDLELWKMSNQREKECARRGGLPKSVDDTLSHALPFAYQKFQVAGLFAKWMFRSSLFRSANGPLHPSSRQQYLSAFEGRPH